MNFAHLMILATMIFCSTHQVFAKEGGSLSIKLKAMADHIVVGEPIVLDVTLTNAGDQPVQVSRELGRGSDSSRYFISIDGEEFRHLSGFLSERWSRPVSLAANGELKHLEWVHTDLDRSRSDRSSVALVTDKPGKYKIYIQYTTPMNREGNSQTITSESVSIEVRDHQAEHEAYLEILTRRDVAHAIDRGLLRPGSVPPHPRDEELVLATDRMNKGFEELAKSQTPYAPYAALLRGSMELASNEHGMKADEALLVRESRVSASIQYFEIADVATFPLRSEAVWFMREAAATAGNSDLVHQLNQRLEIQFGDTPASQRSPHTPLP